MARRATRNPQGAGTIRKRSDGRWEARYTLGRDPGTGKQVQRSVYGKSQGEVRKKLAALTVSLDQGTYTEPAKITVAQWLDIWVEDFCTSVKPRTKALYQSSVESRIKPALGAVRLSELNTAMIQRFYNDVLEGKKGERKLSPKTVRNLHGILHKALSQAVEIGYIPNNPAAACKLPRVTKPEIRPLDEEETRAFLSQAQGDDYERLFLVALFTGMREGELLGLPWDGVDFEAGTISITQQLQLHQGAYRMAPPKNSKPRLIAPAPFVMEVLREQQQIQKAWKLKAGPLWEDGGLVFTNERGQHLASRTLSRHFKNIVEQIGLPDTRFHDLRHTYAVAALRAGDDPKTVSENLGHASVAFTLDVYGHVTEQMRLDSAGRMQAYIDRLQAME